MSPIRTLYSESTDAKNFQGRGYKLDSSRGHELESQCNELLLETEFFANKCSEFRNAKALAEARSDVITKELEKKNGKILHLQKKLEEANSFQSRIKSLEEELSLTQKYSSKKDSEIMSLKAELALKNDEFERLKLDTISAELAWPKSVITGGNEKNKLNKSLAKYFVPKKIDDKIQPSSEISLEVSNTEIGKDTQSGVSSILNIPEPIDTECQVQEKKNMIPYLTQWENSRFKEPLLCNTISQNETYPQISIRSPLIALLLFTLLIIFTVWITFIRPMWNRQKKIKNKNNNIYIDTIPLIQL